MPGLSVVCPCLNEEANLPALVARLNVVFQSLPPEARDQAELILIDDGSRDRTWTCMETLRQASPFVRTVRHATTRGIAAAWRSAVTQARGDWICVLDADLQYQPEEIPRLWRTLHDTKADIVQGVRSAADRRRDVRYLLSRGLNGILNQIFGMTLRDNKSGFFLCRRDVLAQLLTFRGAYRHWQCFVMVAAHHHGYRIHELETPFLARAAGRSAFGNVAVLPTVAVAIDLVRAVREYRGARA